MKFEKLILENFASYYGQHIFDFNTDQEKPVVIIVGNNGYGKTSMFQGINWALYGEDYEKDLRKYKNRNILDYINEAAVREAIQANKNINISATLYFSHNGSKYYMTQLVEAAPTKVDGKFTLKQVYRAANLYEVNPSGDNKDIAHYKLLLNEILPSNVRDYFLFDGDRIYALASPGSSSDVRDAIYRVVDLELLQNGKEHLEGIAKDYAREAKKESTGELAEIEDKYNSKIDLKDSKQSELKENATQIRSIKEQLNKIDDKLKELPDTKGIQEKIESLKLQVRAIIKQIDDLNVEKRKHAYSYSGVLLSDIAIELINDLDSKRKRGEIPKNISKTFLEEMLRSKKCFICNEDIVEGNKLYKAIMERLEEEKKKKDNQILIDYNFLLKGLSSIIGDSGEELKTIDTKISNLDKKKIELNLEIDQNQKELEKLPKENIQGLIEEQRARRSALENFIRNEANLQRRIEDLDDEISTLDKTRKELAKKQKNVQALQLRESLARTASDQISEIYEIFAEDSRSSVEQFTIDEFKNFVFSSSEYHVSLNKDYELVVMDSNGNKVLQRLSMGQSQCLSLAFITAISRVSQKHPPLVIDMPFGRLDEAVHDTVSKRLPELTSQLILFLLPNTEWNQTTQRNLKPKAKYIYQLEFDNKSRKTMVRKYE